MSPSSRNRAHLAPGTRAGLLLLALAACAGRAPPAGHDPGGSAGGVAAGGAAGESCAAAPAPAPPRWRRLSRVEYVHAVAALLPALSPARIQDLIALPADATVDGFENQERAQAASALWLEEVEAAAVALARAAVAEGAGALLGCARDAAGADCARGFLARLGRRAFRRPLSQEELARYEALFDETARAIDRDAAAEVVVAAFLQSPHFLYRSEGTGDPFEEASRLSFLLWQAPPDDELLARAAEGALARPEGRAAEVARLFGDARAAAAFADFTRQWLELAPLPERRKDPDAFPSWTPAGARRALDETAWLAGRVFADGGTLADLLRAPRPWPEAPAREEPAHARAGILTRPAFLALHARSLHGSPPLRGLAVMRQLLCAALPAPPADADLSEPLPEPGAASTNRERFAARTAPARCAGCHARSDAIGFAFEHYDAVGAYRELDAGRPVDATGYLAGAGSADGPVRDAIELSARLARSEVVLDCLAERAFQYAEGRAPGMADACRLSALRARVREQGGVLQALVRELALGAWAGRAADDGAARAGGAR